MSPHRAAVPFNARFAEQWREGRVLVAGDAAHQMPPFAGQGMCAGIRDAANLAWKLDLVLRGAAPDALLGTYQEERLPSARTAIEFSMELGKVICVPDAAAAAARDEAMAAAVGEEPSHVPDLPGPDTGLVHPAAPHAGHLFVQGDVRGVPFDDVHGAGWRLVTIDAAPLPADHLDWFATLGGRVVVLGAPGDVHARWFGDHDVTWALQRPDFRLYGTARCADDAARLLRDLREHLAGDLAAPVTDDQLGDTNRSTTGAAT